MSNWISSGIGTGTGGIPTTDNIPETTEKLLFLMNMIKLKVLKNRLLVIFSVGKPNISVVSNILSVGHPSFSVVSGILSVVGIPYQYPRKFSCSCIPPSKFLILEYKSHKNYKKHDFLLLIEIFLKIIFI